MAPRFGHGCRGWAWDRWRVRPTLGAVHWARSANSDRSPFPESHGVTAQRRRRGSAPPPRCQPRGGWLPPIRIPNGGFWFSFGSSRRSRWKWCRPRRARFGDASGSSSATTGFTSARRRPVPRHPTPTRGTPRLRSCVRRKLSRLSEACLVGVFKEGCWNPEFRNWVLQWSAATKGAPWTVVGTTGPFLREAKHVTGRQPERERERGRWWQQRGYKRKRWRREQQQWQW
mmetsp:Transcript_4841/g.14435  ORF Transcript_4841/g.14435 Transcript_4841/m.14435 type:complete len:229 (+) Transcript_4841:1449-2135(+)